MDKKEFGIRLAKIRQEKKISARDLSLSLGQSPGYINNIENGLNFPSMTMFFTICQYLQVTESAFFDTELTDPVRAEELLRMTKKMSSKQLERLIFMAQWLK